MEKSRLYEETLINDLKNPEEAVEYLKASLDDGNPAIFLQALKDVAKAHGGISTVAQKAHLNRENMYRMLSTKGNPRINSLNMVLHALGMKLSIDIEDQVKTS